MMCDMCGEKSARIEYIARNYGKGGDLLIIENIPVVRCAHCGESYLTADTLHEIERIRLHKKEFSRKRAIAVAEFA